MPTVALVGRQNVGKSTLVNRLLGSREAIADRAPGVTRDRVAREVDWNGHRFDLVDTGGYLRRASGIEAAVARQADRAIDTADVVVLVVDGRSGPTEEDLDLAKRLRRHRGPVVVAVNKLDGEEDRGAAAAFHRLGLGDPSPISAAQGRGIAELLERVVGAFPERGGERRITDDLPAFALVGRPNVGKSSLFNRLVGEERSVVYEEAGTTRDAVDAIVAWPDGAVRFVDTAGLRRTSRSSRGVEYYGFLRSERAIERSDVAVLVLDGSAGFTTEDRRIAARVIELGRALVVVANKWDLVEDKDETFGRFREGARRFLDAPVARVSARSATGITRLPALLLGAHARWTSRATTAVVNRIVRAAQEERGGIRYRYASQVATAPPTFVLFGAGSPGAATERYLEHRLRDRLDLGGVPIRLKFRAKPDRSDR